MAPDDPARPEGSEDLERFAKALERLEDPLVCGRCGFESDSAYAWKGVVEVDDEGREVAVLLCPVCGGEHSRHW
jgi:hypothetical protein